MPTQAAMRATKAIFEMDTYSGSEVKPEAMGAIAEVIDEATGLPELLDSKAILKTCPHIETTTAVMAAGDSFTHLNSLNPEGKHDCEVCRKLLAFDGLLEACKEAYWHIRSVNDDEPMDDEVADNAHCMQYVWEKITAAIAKAEPTP